MRTLTEYVVVLFMLFSTLLPAQPPPTAPRMVVAARPLPLPTWLPSTAPSTPPATTPTPEPWPSRVIGVTDSIVPQLLHTGTTGAGAGACATSTGCVGAVADSAAPAVPLVPDAPVADGCELALTVSIGFVGDGTCVDTCVAAGAGGLGAGLILTGATLMGAVGKLFAATTGVAGEAVAGDVADVLAGAIWGAASVGWAGAVRACAAGNGMGKPAESVRTCVCISAAPSATTHTLNAPTAIHKGLLLGDVAEAMALSGKAGEAEFMGFSKNESP
jgi:hypothetical protein